MRNSMQYEQALVIRQVQFEPAKPANATSAATQQARLKGICYKCKEPWSPRHRKLCKFLNKLNSSTASSISWGGTYHSLNYLWRGQWQWYSTANFMHAILGTKAKKCKLRNHWSGNFAGRFILLLFCYNLVVCILNVLSNSWDHVDAETGLIEIFSILIFTLYLINV